MFYAFPFFLLLVPCKYWNFARFKSGYKVKLIINHLNSKVMKKVLFIFTVALISITATGQQFSKKSTGGGGFKIDMGSAKEVSSITVESKTFKVLQLESGGKFVKAISKTGNEYPVWIGNETEFLFEGKKVYQMKSGTYCVYKLTAKGYPTPVYLKKE